MKSSAPNHSAADGIVDTPPQLALTLAQALLPQCPEPVLDPACGTGELLLAVLRHTRVSADWAGRNLFGIELRPDRARSARERIRLELGCEADSLLAQCLERNIRCADGLDPATNWPTGTHVIANPPWVSLSGRQAAELPAEREQLYRRSWAAFAGWPSLHGAFLERIARHLAECEGRARVLVPAPVCELDGYRATRGLVLAHSVLDGDPVELGEGAFPGITQPAVVVALRGRASLAALDSAPWIATPGAGRDEAVEFAVELEARLVRFPRLPARSFADPGVHTGNSARDLVFDDPGPGRAPVRVGRNLTAFSLAAANRYLRVDLEPGSGRVFRVPSLERMRAFPVLVRQTAARPIAALHEPGAHFRNSLLACRVVPDLDPAFVVAVLNGPVAGAWHRMAFRDARQRAFPQVKVKHLATQPFPIACRSERPEFHDDIVRRVHALRSLLPAEPAFESAVFESAVEEISLRVLSAFGLPPSIERRARDVSARR